MSSEPVLQVLKVLIVTEQAACFQFLEEVTGHRRTSSSSAQYQSRVSDNSLGTLSLDISNTSTHPPSIRSIYIDLLSVEIYLLSVEIYLLSVEIYLHLPYL